MIRAVQTAADKAAFARCAAAAPPLRAMLGRDLLLWADNPGAPVKLFCLSDAAGVVTAALDLYGSSALLAGTVGEGEHEELAAFLRFAGVEKLRTPALLPGWPEFEPLYAYQWAGGPALPLPAGTVLEPEPPVSALAALLFPADAARRDAYYVTTCAADSRGLARQWLLRDAGGTPVSTVGAGALCDGEAYLDMGYTLPAARRRGLFAALITHVTEALSKEGYRVTLNCAGHLCPFYERLGFTRFGILRQYNTNCIN